MYKISECSKNNYIVEYILKKYIYGGGNHMSRKTMLYISAAVISVGIIGVLLSPSIPVTIGLTALGTTVGLIALKQKRIVTIKI